MPHRHHPLVASLLALALAACSGGGEQVETPEPDTGEQTETSVLETTPEDCAECHPNHSKDWEGSMHAYATKDPIFQAMLAKGVAETDGKLDQFCIQCHAPVASKEGMTPVAVVDGTHAMALDMESPLIGHGVVCTSCHAAESVEATLNAEYTLSKDTLYGPTGAGSEAHTIAQSDLLTDAILCGACHNVVNPKGALLENTFSEWYAGPFNDGSADDKSCVDCHMPAYQGEIVEGVEREIHRHTFVGVDLALIDDFPDKERQRRLVEELLRTAGKLELRRVPDVNGELALRVDVTNINNGHALPSGSTADRQVWVHLRVTDGQGRLVYESGMTDPNGDLMDRVTGHSLTPDGDPELLLYGSLLFGDDGEHVNFPWQAKRSQDFLLQPGQTGWREYLIPRVDLFDVERLEVRAVLKYRTFPPFLIRELKAEGFLEEEAVPSEVPIVDMAEAQLSITL